jgi:XTP/dITP diphosphohydrolase
VLAPGKDQDSPASGLPGERRISVFLASSNAGKLKELRALASTLRGGISLDLQLLPTFSSVPVFEEKASTFSENAAGKASYYSKISDSPVIADDSGLVVDALGGAPGVHSARYAGPDASSAERNAKLLYEMRASGSKDRRARFVCVIALALSGRIVAVLSDSVEGEILEHPRGTGGFGYDPVFFFPQAGKCFAEMSAEEKNHYSHRAKAFCKLADFLENTPVL